MVSPDSGSEVLKIDGVTLLAAGGAAVWDANLTLARGDLALILQAVGAHLPPLADACAGLFEPTRGAVYFQGEDWRTLSPDRANAARGTIGRVFADGGWLEHQDITANIMLSQLHHSQRDRADLRAEALRLARRFGLPGLPRRAVAGALDTDLRRAACVRALMGSPRAILLEHPGHDAPGIIGPLINTLNERRADGAAVLWITHDPKVWRLQAVRPTARYQLVGSQLIAV